jgi:prophage tail gpP-like protein
MFNRVTRTWTSTKEETLGSIALEVYTDISKASVIQKANKQTITNPNKIKRGTKLYIPPINEDISTTDVAGVNKRNFRLTIDDTHVEFITELQYTMASTQGLRVAAFSAPAEAIPQAKVGSTVKITINRTPFLIGWLIQPDVEISKDGGHVVHWQVASYAYPLVHSNFKTTAGTPSSWKDITLQDLITKVLQDTGVSLVLADTTVGAEKYEKIGFDNSETIMSFIIKVAQKKKYSIQGMANGDLLMYQSTTIGTPVGSFNDTTRMRCSYNYEGLAQEYRATSQKTGKGGTGTASNTLLPFKIFRHLSQDRGAEGDLTKYAEYQQALEYAASTTMQIETSTLFNDNGDVWEPDNSITVKAPPLGYKKDTLLIVDSVNGRISREGEYTTLGCVPPELRRGETPKELPLT